MKMTCVANNVDKKVISKLKSSWGLSFFVSTNGNKILFDTGSNGEELIHNLETLEIDPGEIECIVISHKHRDHAGGLEGILKLNSKIRVIYPTRGKIYFSKNLFTSGNIGICIREQALCIDSGGNIILLTGCAHPGIAAMVKKVMKDTGKRVYGLFGGFHLEYHPAFIINKIIRCLKDLGVEKAGPSHCTGEKAIRLFRSAFKNNFLEFNLGDKIEL